VATLTPVTQNLPVELQGYYIDGYIYVKFQYKITRSSSYPRDKVTYISVSDSPTILYFKQDGNDWNNSTSDIPDSGTLGPFKLKPGAGTHTLKWLIRTRNYQWSAEQREYTGTLGVSVIAYTKPTIDLGGQILRVNADTGSVEETGQGFKLPIVVKGKTYGDFNQTTIKKVEIAIENVWYDCILYNEWYIFDGTALSVDSEYDIRVTFGDSLTSLQKIYKLPSMKFLVFFHEDGKHIGVGTSNVPDPDPGKVGTVCFSKDWNIYFGDVKFR
jgi:hypothetical protein